MAKDKCKLTGDEGRFVKSHVIPKALTLPEAPGLPFIQGGSGKRAVRRWHSWYDKTIVTEQGEALLSLYDDWAIKWLRENKLVWSGWGPLVKLGSMHTLIPGTDWGVRSIKVDQPEMLRLFLLSLLWRAAVSSLSEFDEVRLTDDEIEKLRKMLVDWNPEPYDYYPASLTQFSTMGVIHNMVPIAQDKVVPAFLGVKEYVQPIFRFYFDGLVAHMHRTDEANMGRDRSNVIAGAGPNLVVTTIEFEGSFAQENLFNVMNETIYK